MFKAKKTALSEGREATPDDEAMIRRREGEALEDLEDLGVDESAPVWPHYYVMRGAHGEEYPILRRVFDETYEIVES